MPHSSLYCRFPKCTVWINVQHSQGADAVHEAYIQLVQHELTHTCVKCGYVPPHGPNAPPFWQAFESHHCIALSTREFPLYLNDIEY